jgi:predicted PurR-regulated permease PerM
MTSPVRPAQPDSIDVFLRLALLAILAFACFRLLQPVFGLLLWAVLLAVLQWPAHVRLRKSRLGNAGSATVIGLAGGLLLIVPAVIVIVSVSESIGKLLDLREAQALALPPPPAALSAIPVLGRRLAAAWEAASTDLPAYLEAHGAQAKAIVQWLSDKAGSLLTGLLFFVGAVALGAVLLAFGDALAGQARRLAARIANGSARGGQLLDLSVATVRGVLQGVVGVALIQAALLGVGFFLAGIPFPGVLVLLAVLLGILQIPGIVVALPAIAWAWGHLDSRTATLFTVWTLVAGLSDNVLKPLLLGRGLDVPMPVIFLGVIGGMIADGLLGLFIGPVILAVGYRLAQEWLDRPVAD